MPVVNEILVKVVPEVQFKQKNFFIRVTVSCYLPIHVYVV